ncbi:MAG: hypothetical protein ABJ092_14700 [Gillisia sp.]
MKENFCNLYLAKTNGIPKDNSGTDFEVVYCIENNNEISSDLKEIADLKYFLIVLQKTGADLENGIRKVEAEWKKFSDLNLELEFITDNLTKMTKSFKNLLKECDNETVIFKSQAVGFHENSVNETKEARKLLLGVATKSKLNFWE